MCGPRGLNVNTALCFGHAHLKSRGWFTFNIEFCLTFCTFNSSIIFTFSFLTSRQLMIWAESTLFVQVLLTADLVRLSSRVEGSGSQVQVASPQSTITAKHNHRSPLTAHRSPLTPITLLTPLTAHTTHRVAIAHRWATAPLWTPGINVGSLCLIRKTGNCESKELFLYAKAG